MASIRTSHEGYDPANSSSFLNLQQANASGPLYPPPQGPGSMRQVRMVNDGLPQSFKPLDVERGRPTAMPSPETHTRPTNSRNSSWDILAGIKKFEHGYEEFDSRNASTAHLAYADGDIPKNKISRLYNYLLNVSIVSRWIIFIVPVLAILWIPGILGITKFPNAAVWGVKLLWWSIWLSVVWGGWWASLAAAWALPSIIRSTVGLIAVGSRKYIDWLAVLHRFVALFGWTLAIWITFNPLIDRQQKEGASPNSVSNISLIGKLLFALYLCAGLLLFEKFSIQWIAGKFHERSYAERIADQKFAVKSLVTLYRNSVDVPGRPGLNTSESTPSLDPRRFFKKALQGVRVAATTTTTALGNVASEIAGSSVLQPNSPQAMVKTALESPNKSLALARRLFYSFAKPHSESMFVEDIARFFPNQDIADAVFALFDKDSNGDATREEVEMACMEFHREQLSIEHSMQDLDSAVGRLDNILMSVYILVAIIIIAVALEAQLATLVTGAGTLILGLSWLIGSSLAEVLTSIIFLFVKHPFDVGDRIDLTSGSYTVKEIRLLSSVLIDANGVVVQAPNTVLNSMFIQNIRRSGQMSEPFIFDVSYATTFEQIEQLREKMLSFLQAERRDYQTTFDVTVVDFPDQEKMTLKADIKYKSNSQQGAVKAKRRNKWVCSLKTILADLEIYGPTGNPNAKAGPTKYTLVPWEKVEREEQEAQQAPSELAPAGGWKFSDKNAPMLEDAKDIFGDSEELQMNGSGRSTPAQSLRSRSKNVAMPDPITMPSPRS